ncbi:hypothetical protein D3870_20125 [Noviherbaspirillum cavernae]|uniref:Flagellar hook-length control protein FliK n=1 Tax=Noviherbaspirillum cavernae TaxID=2320862 RepID=A0A418WVM2_9BURK|nr:hypothetical protein [Noviherbaspirillum cavernae]RJF96717.1 hypothetical protein D3870_20125 [Noviherbaspirillum cavernae]
MPLERIAAAVSLPPVQNSTGNAHRFVPGEMVRLTLDAIGADEMLATTADGLQLRLTGLGSLAHSLTPGEMLNLRVLATTPRLELAFSGTSARSTHISVSISADAVAPGQTAAMRLDQVALLRQVVPQRPDAAALAASWRAMAQGYLERHASFPEQLLELRLPAAMPAGRAVAGAEQWLFAPSAYGSHRVMLNVLQAYEDEVTRSEKQKQRQERQRKGRRTTIALLLESILPGMGRVVVQMQLASGDVLLELYCEEKALPPLRKLLPEIISSIGRADLRVARCRLLRSAPRVSAHGLNPQTGLSPALFRAAAEVVLLFSSPSLPAAIRRPGR